MEVTHRDTDPLQSREVAVQRDDHGPALFERLADLFEDRPLICTQLGRNPFLPMLLVGLAPARGLRYSVFMRLLSYMPLPVLVPKPNNWSPAFLPPILSAFVSVCTLKCLAIFSRL